jgi:hypothetical protein
MAKKSPPEGQAGSQRKLLGVLKLSKPIGEMTSEELHEVAAQVAKQAERRSQ